MNKSMSRRQIVSKSDDLFDIIRDTQTWLSTVEWTNYTSHLSIYVNINNFESCLFTADDSNVIARYHTWEEAVKNHKILAEKYNLTIHEERVIVEQ